MLNQDLMVTCHYVIGRYRTLSEHEHSIIFALSKNLSAKSASKRENVGTRLLRGPKSATIISGRKKEHVFCLFSDSPRKSFTPAYPISVFVDYGEPLWWIFIEWGGKLWARFAPTRSCVFVWRSHNPFRLKKRAKSLLAFMKPKGSLRQRSRGNSRQNLSRVTTWLLRSFASKYPTIDFAF